MKLSLVVGGAIGYVLGAKAGRERYEEIIRVGRRVGGSQTVQATAGVLQGQLDMVAQRARGLISARIGGSGGHADLSRANGYHAG